MSHVPDDHAHDHGHGHGHGHGHSHDGDVALPAWADPEVPDTELAPAAVRRRNVLRGAGLLGAGAFTAAVVGRPQSASAASASSSLSSNDAKEYTYLAGDHHIHTQFSSDAMYRPQDQAFQASRCGLDWMVITDHGSVGHYKYGVEKVNPGIKQARAALKDLLVFQGLEWNIPAAEHATVIVAPGANEVSVLKQFETDYDGTVKGASTGAEGNAATAANEALAIQGLQWLAGQIGAKGGVDDAVMLANHPARKGLDTPHEFRAWRDQGKGVAIGMEGAPGHQAGGMPDGYHTDGPRGEYGFTPSTSGANAWSGYTTDNFEFYRTWGGFDPFTAMVGGLWDSLLSEGKGWWITSNSDSHKVLLDPFVSGPIAPKADGTAASSFSDSGAYLAAVEVAQASADNALGYSDFFPGYYSRTHVGASSFGYGAVLKGLRQGNVWVDHGGLVDDLQVRVEGSTLGGLVQVERGDNVTLEIVITPAQGVNHHGDLPKLAKVDVIRGLITGAVTDKDTFTAPETAVVQTFDVSAKKGTYKLKVRFKKVQDSFYVRLRGSDGNRLGAGYYASQDPEGPVMDVIGDADPWADLWFYSNPVFVEVK